MNIVHSYLLRCAPVLGEPRFGSRKTMLWFSDIHALVLRDTCSGSRRTVLWFSGNRALVLREPCFGSQRTVLWFSENRALVLRELCSVSQRTELWVSDNRSPNEMFSGSPNIWIAHLEPKIFVSLHWEPKLHFVGVCGESIRQIKRNNCIRGE